MTEVEANQAIIDQWEDVWDAQHPTDSSDPDHVPYTYTNEDFSPADLGDLGAWVRVTIIPSTSEQTTMGAEGARKFERRGNVFVQLFTPLNQGTLLISELADDVTTTLQGKRLGDLLLYAANPGPIVEESSWLSRTVVIPYRYTQIG